MVKPEWGAKHLCENCGAKYYDMLRDPITCPKCDTIVSAPSRSRRGKAAAVKEEAPKAPVKKPIVDELDDDVDDLLVDDDDDDADDDSLLDDDEDDDEYSTDDIPLVVGGDDDDKDI
ncbi:MAG: FYDLN acid domain-containing protein [Alphaproteobacteria bacterium]